MASAPAEADASGESERVVLPPRARQGAISERCSFDGHQEARSHQRSNVRAMYDALIRREGPLSERDLRDYFDPAGTGAPEQGLYADVQFGRFWDDVGHRSLRVLPGIEASADGLRFVGVDPDPDPETTGSGTGTGTGAGDGTSINVASDDDADVRPLSAFRSDPRVVARNYLDRSHGPHSDETSDLLTLWDMVAEAGETTTAELERDYRTPDLDRYGAALAECPHIEREVSGPPEPDDVPIETYADVLAARERVEAPPETVWSFDPARP